jgi:hypothetical protein
MSRRAVALASATLTAVLAGCEAALDQRLADVTAPRVLAITATPAEAAPGATVSLTALVVGPDGPRADVPSWAFCAAPTPSTEPNPVADGCLTDPRQVRPLGAAVTLSTTLPDDACLLFGPATKPGGFRPRDPDPTGGYYQPVRATITTADGALIALGEPRITCDLALAPAALVQAYRVGYVANAGPVIAGVELSAGGVVIDPAAAPRDAEVTVTARWPPASAETYLRYDPTAVALVTAREALRASWFTTAGHLAVDATLVGEEDPATSAATTYRTPATLGPAWLWVVLRDSRGGIATAQVALQVQ